MIRPQELRRIRRAARIGLTAAMLCGLIAGTVGFSVAPPASIGGAFPCQGSGCGCLTANDCWFGCCCMSPAQRLAWAKRNDVKPPTELVRLVKGGERSPRLVRSCCVKDDKATCCRPEGGTSKTCCAPMQCKTTARSSGSDERSPVIAPSRCGGVGKWWVVSGQPFGLPGPPASLPRPACVEPVVLAFTGYASERDAPPTRPG